MAPALNNAKAQCRCVLWYTAFGDSLLHNASFDQAWDCSKDSGNVAPSKHWIINHCDKRTITAVFITPQIDISITGEATYFTSLKAIFQYHLSYITGTATHTKESWPITAGGVNIQNLHFWQMQTCWNESTEYVDNIDRKSRLMAPLHFFKSHWLFKIVIKGMTASNWWALDLICLAFQWWGMHS